MIDEKTTEKIEQIASEIVIKISNMALSTPEGKGGTTQRELTKMRLTESVKMNKYFLKVYGAFYSSAHKTD